MSNNDTPKTKNCAMEPTPTPLGEVPGIQLGETSQSVTFGNGFGSWCEAWKAMVELV